MGVIHISRVSGAADTADQGHLVWGELVSALEFHDQIVVSFAGVSTATSSFVNNSFVRLLERMPFGEVKRRIRIIESTRQINEMIKSRLSSEARQPHAA